jgi:hypothetical protein
MEMVDGPPPYVDCQVVTGPWESSPIKAGDTLEQSAQSAHS